MKARKCPLCLKEMSQQMRAGVTVDSCPSCQGIFLDRGELASLTLEWPGLEERLLAASESRPNQRTCPDCKAKLCTVRTAQYVFDRCDTCGGFFLGEDTLSRVSRPATPSGVYRRLSSGTYRAYKNNQWNKGFF